MADESVPKTVYSKKQAKLAVCALLAHLKDKSEKVKRKDVLFEKDDGLWLSVSFKKIPQVLKKPKKIPLQHSLHKNSEVLFISKEPGKVLKEAFAKKGVTTVNKVISLTKVRKEYKTFLLKRQLVAAYDVILCDDRIYPMVCKSLGKECFKKKKEPIPIRLSYEDWAMEINKSLHCTLFRMGHGPCSCIRVGLVNLHSEKELVENVQHALKVIGTKVPGSWKNIRSIHIKSSNSVSLPIFQSSPLSNVDIEEIPDDVPEKRFKRKRKSNVTTETDKDDVNADEAEKENTDEKENEIIEETAVPEVNENDEKAPIKKKKKKTDSKSEVGKSKKNIGAKSKKKKQKSE